VHASTGPTTALIRTLWAPPGRGNGGHLTPLDFDIKFSHIINVAPRVEIQMQFLFSESVSFVSEALMFARLP